MTTKRISAKPIDTSWLNLYIRVRRTEFVSPSGLDTGSEYYCEGKFQPFTTKAGEAEALNHALVYNFGSTAEEAANETVKELLEVPENERC